MCPDDMIVIHMEQLAHRDWRAGQRPKGGAGIFQGHRHQILSQLGILTFPPRVLSQANAKYQIPNTEYSLNLGSWHVLSTCYHKHCIAPKYDFPSKQYFGLGHPFQPLGSILGPN